MGGIHRRGGKVKRINQKFPPLDKTSGKNKKRLRDENWIDCRNWNRARIG